MTLALVVYVGLVMLSRMYLGKHYLTDVIAGMSLAVVFGVLGLLLKYYYEKYKDKNKKQKENITE